MTNQGGGGITTPTSEDKKNTFSVIFVKESGVNRAINLGHEVLGHGRSLSLGRVSGAQQHVDAIQVENLIRRVLGVGGFVDGSNHADGTKIKNAQALPSFR
ncbi:MAG: hypothetical protein IKR88_01945 [Bacteroidales bacterium]|nr:hypothetical protein [Bacteroidales bacterium]